MNAKDKIQDGYLYKINGVIAGSGFARNVIDKLVLEGLDDDIIQSVIFITDSEGITTNMKWHKISNITWEDNKI